MVISKLERERKLALSMSTSKRMKPARFTSDQISILPDEILGSILSLLTLKEAAGTSVLSKGWMHLWTFFTGSLIFDASKKLFCGNMAVVKRERSKYVKWLNKVIDSHKGNSIDELCVWFDLDESFSSDIDRWVKFAISKRVQRLTVDFTRVIWIDYGQKYSFEAGRLGILNKSFNTNFLTSLCQLEFFKLSTTPDAGQLHHEPPWGKKRKMMMNAPALSHQCLKVVEFLGFGGKIGQLNLAIYMIKSSIKLKKLVIDSCLPRPCIPTPAWDFKETKKTQAAKVSAMQLEKKLPPGAKLFVK